MAKKKDTKAEAKAAKRAIIAKKIERKAKKKENKSKDTVEDEDQDLEAILEEMQRNWEDQHKVTEELVEGPPSRRANATLTPCPAGNYLWCIGGEFFSEDKKAYFYNDVFRYSPDKDEWRKFISPTCPGPRSAHAVAATTAGGGKLFLFGGEFSSLHQTTFHHYRDFWCFDVCTHSWDRIETKVLPSARSGHRMSMWKHYVVLFGGFYDPGIKTKYLCDLWLFDTQEYQWKQVEYKKHELVPSARSGFSFLSTPDGILLHGGYCKEYSKNKRPVGVMLEDTWFLRMSLPTDTDSLKSSFNMPIMKWEKRKRSATAYTPSIRSGCTMALWQAKNMGVLFGGVTDEDTNEETLESVFHNDLYGYQMSGNGRWVSMTLKRPKQKGVKKKQKVKPSAQNISRQSKLEEGDESGEVLDSEYNSDKEDKPWLKAQRPPSPVEVTETSGDGDTDDPNLTTPLPRYNAILAVLRNTLYIYGGIFEKGTREYTLDDFHSLHLEKLDRFVCLKKSDVVIPADPVESSSDEDDGHEDSNDESDNSSEYGDMAAPPARPLTMGDHDKGGQVEPSLEEEVEGVLEKDPLRAQATAFKEVSKDSTRSQEDIISTPLPGETLALFYARSREYWIQKAHQSSDDRGKVLRRAGFALAQERYAAYKPLLKEVEKILAEAGLNEEEMKSVAVAPDGKLGQSRNRR